MIVLNDQNLDVIDDSQYSQSLIIAVNDESFLNDNLLQRDSVPLG